MKLSILLAGANGMIGSFLYNRFKNDFSISCMDYGKGVNEENIISLDLTQKLDVQAFAEESSKYDVLIFLVGLAHK